MKVIGRGNGIRNSRVYKMILDIDHCSTDGEHEWRTYKNDPTQEFCVRCCEFRKKGVD